MGSLVPYIARFYESFSTSEFQHLAIVGRLFNYCETLEFKPKFFLDPPALHLFRHHESSRLDSERK